MAKIVLLDAKKQDILEGGRPYLDSLEMRLFNADITPTGTVMPSTPSDECDDPGYLADAPLLNPFPAPTFQDGIYGAVAVDADTITFDHGAGDQTIYGVFWTDPADSDITVMAQRMDVPFTVTAAGQVFVISGNLHLDKIP